jgi:hypothetical protein
MENLIKEAVKKIELAYPNQGDESAEKGLQRCLDNQEVPVSAELLAEILRVEYGIIETRYVKANADWLYGLKKGAVFKVLREYFDNGEGQVIAADCTGAINGYPSVFFDDCDKREYILSE